MATKYLVSWINESTYNNGTLLCKDKEDALCNASIHIDSGDIVTIEPWNGSE